MARISAQSTIDRSQRIQQLISQSDGITEGEMVDALKLERRTINNYLRNLAAQGLVYKDGRCWYASAESELDAIRNQLVAAIDRLFDYLKRGRI